MIGSHPLAHRRRAISPFPKFIVDFARLRLLDSPRFNAVVLSQELMTTQFGNLVAISLIYTVALGLPLARASGALLKSRVSVWFHPSSTQLKTSMKWINQRFT